MLTDPTCVAGSLRGSSLSPASMFNHARMTVREDWTRRFREIAQPVLVIHGVDEPLLPVENGRAIAEGIDGAEILEFAGMEHELPGTKLGGIAERAAMHAQLRQR